MSEGQFTRLETTKRIKPLTDKFYRELNEAHERGQKVAWLYGAVPYAPFRAFQDHVKFMHLENYGARLAARKVAQPFFRVAEEMGMSKDSCSYLRGPYGVSCCINGDAPTPPGVESYLLPKPDMLVCINYCSSAINMVETLYRTYKVPAFIIDTRQSIIEGDTEEREPYFLQNYKELISFLEEQVGRPMDYDRLGEIVYWIREMVLLSREIQSMAKNIPSPMTIFDQWISLGAGNIWVGTPESLDYYTALKAEVAQRVADKAAAVPGESVRLIFDNIALWPRVGHLSRLLYSLHAAAVWHLYSWGMVCQNPELLDPAHPVESLAKDQANRSPYAHWKEIASRTAEAIEEFSVDGMIGPLLHTCRKHIHAPLMHEMISAKTGIPVLEFEADNADEAFFADRQIDTRIAAFVEMLETRKARARARARA